MKLATAGAASLMAASLLASPHVFADEHHGGHEEHHGGPPPGQQHRDERREHEVQRLPPRPTPPTWQGHPPGPHPTNPQWHPAYHPHPVRVVSPRVIHYGEHPWHRWGHPEFARPLYYWNWAVIQNVSCVAEDSYGDQYPVTEATWEGFGLVNMTTVEDDALDRCYEESGGDQSCHLMTCSHF